MAQSSDNPSDRRAPNGLYRMLLRSHLSVAGFGIGLFLVALVSTLWVGDRTEKLATEEVSLLEPMVEDAAVAGETVQAGEGAANLLQRLQRHAVEIGVSVDLAIGLMVLLAALMVLAAQLLAQRRAKELGKPIQELTVAAKALEADGLKEALEVGGPDEFGRLTKAFNAMRVALVRSRSYLEYRVKIGRRDLLEANAKLEAEASQRHRAETALQAFAAKEKALLEVLPDLMFRIDQSGTLLDCRGPEEAQIDPEYFIGRRIGDMLTESFAEATLIHLEQVLAGAGVQVFACEVPLDGQLRTYECRLAGWGDGQALMMVRDTTQDRGAEETELQ